MHSSEGGEDASPSRPLSTSKLCGANEAQRSLRPNKRLVGRLMFDSGITPKDSFSYYDVPAALR